MSVTIAQSRRPLAMFEYAEDGKYVIVKIMQHGDKFSVTEKNAEEWLEHIHREALAGRYDSTWVSQFKLEYEAFLKGNELPRDGTPILTWGMIGREPAKRLVALGISTVEDLAALPDSGLGNVGLDGRVLRDKARNFLEAGQGAQGLAKRLADLEQSERDNKATIERQAAQIAELKAKKAA